MRAQQSFQWSNITATAVPTSPPGCGNKYSNSFSLNAGGIYQLSAVATTFGTGAQLNAVGPDGATLLPVSSSLTANGGQTLDLPPGAYVLTLTGTFVGFYATLTRLPEE